MLDRRKPEEINLREYWRVLVKRKRLVTKIAGGAFIASIVLSLLLPNIYASTTKILPPPQSTSMVGGIRLPSGLGSLAGGFLDISSPADTWVGILESENVRDAVIDRFNLRKLYDEDTIEETRKALDERLAIEISNEEIISITMEDKKPARAAQIANAMVMELDRVNKELIMTSGKRTRMFIEKRLDDTKRGLAKAEEALKMFQENNKAVQLEEQAKVIIEAIGEIKARLVAKQVALNTLRSYAASTNPKVEILKAEVGELKNSLRELEKKEKGAESVFIGVEAIPGLALQYARLYREAKVQQTLYELLTQQYEMARIQEAKDSPTVQILDVARVPEKQVKPKKILIILLSTFTAVFIGILIAFGKEALEKIRKEEPSGALS